MEVNGVEWMYTEGLTVADFMEKYNYPKVGTAVELNGEILSKNLWHERILLPEDKLEIVTFVGGG